MANMDHASLTYEVLMYLESYYFTLLGCTEIGTLALKLMSPTNTNDDEDENRYDWEEVREVRDTQYECMMMALILLLATLRNYLGRRGCLADRDWSVIVSVVLTIPCMLGMLFLIFWQFTIVRLERVLCSLMLLLHATELVYACKFAYSTCQPVTYT